VPKLIAQDIPLLESLLAGVFPGATLVSLREQRVREQLERLREKFNILTTE
jgi:hypothetical protein